MNTDLFYTQLPILRNFWDITNPNNFVAMPEDWYILITDVTHSTQAVEEGRYKTVTFLGASSIVVVLNVAKQLDIPFIFGGDGMTLLVPPSLLQAARDALLGLQLLAQNRFGLHLRVGVVPIKDVLNNGYEVKIAKVGISEHYAQANFLGRGLTYATALVKADRADNPYQVVGHHQPEPDFSGLECRWQDIPSVTGQTISLIITTTSHSHHSHQRVYEGVMEAVEEIYGTDSNYRPVNVGRLRLTFNPRKLWLETTLRARSPHWYHRLAYLLNIWLQNLLGCSLMMLKIKAGDTVWGDYKSGLLATTDYRKFDDMLRMVMASTASKTQQLITYLEQEFRAGTLVYGLHIADRALMTCLVFERNGRQVHFVDGADGGYTLAAKALKQRLHRKAINWETYTQMSRHKQRRDRSKF